MKNICLLYLLLIGLSACSGNKSESIISLKGEIKGLGNDTIYLYGVDKLYDRMDTIITKGDKFSAKLSSDTLVAAVLMFSNGVEYPLYMDKGDNIQINGSMDNLAFLDIKGNSANEELTAFNQELKGLGKPSEKVLEQKAESFINTHPASLVSAYLLQKYFVQKPQPDFNEIKKLTEHMTGDLKDRPFVDALLKQIQNDENSSKGKAAPYFHLPNIQGKEISRSDFNNKYLLVHFWASWDEQSRDNNAMYRRLYKKIQKKENFALLGISLDLDKNEWKDAIKKDTLKWEQVCNFKGWDMEPVQQFAIQALPANILINPSGTIEGKGLTEEVIENKIREIEQSEKEVKNKILKAR